VVEIQGSHELRGSQGKSPKFGCSKSRVVKPREDPSHPSEEDRWERLRDLVNSGVCRVNAQVVGVKIHEARGHEVTMWREDPSRPFEENRW
jgi:hypothetical protein